jgi:hypothetical protein
MAPPKVESGGLAVEKYKFGGKWTTPRNLGVVWTPQKLNL